MDLAEEVKTHTRRVEGGERVRYGQACPCCGAAKEEFFRVHDCRRRKFRLVLGRCIQVALSWILARKPWIVPIPGTTKLSRLDENIGSIDLELSRQDIFDINTALHQIKIVGDRYPEAMEKRTGI